jgi:hypothetical protein
MSGEDLGNKVSLMAQEPMAGDRRSFAVAVLKAQTL